MAYIEENRFSILLCDKNPEVVEAWKIHLPIRGWIHIFEGDLFTHYYDALVSPANSQGFMDGGFDSVILHKLGDYIEAGTKKLAPVPVGEARILRLFRKETPHFLIMAPTMETPGDVSETENAFLAMKAILKAADENTSITRVGMTGLCTLTGNMSPDKSASQIARAILEYEEAKQ